VTNRDQNRQFAEAVRRIETELGRKLASSEKRRLHDEINGHGLELEEIVDWGCAMFPR
jgi:hypothetical protein